MKKYILLSLSLLLTACTGTTTLTQHPGETLSTPIANQNQQSSPGIQGEKGITGEQGVAGENGKNGLQGIQGVQGLQGNQGEAGKDGVNLILNSALIYLKDKTTNQSFNEGDMVINTIGEIYLIVDQDKVNLDSDYELYKDSYACSFNEQYDCLFLTSFGYKSLSHAKISGTLSSDAKSINFTWEPVYSATSYTARIISYDTSSPGNITTILLEQDLQLQTSFTYTLPDMIDPYLKFELITHGPRNQTTSTIYLINYLLPRPTPTPVPTPVPPTPTPAPTPAPPTPTPAPTPVPPIPDPIPSEPPIVVED